MSNGNKQSPVFVNYGELPDDIKLGPLERNSPERRLAPEKHAQRQKMYEEGVEEVTQEFINYTGSLDDLEYDTTTGARLSPEDRDSRQKMYEGGSYDMINPDQSLQDIEQFNQINRINHYSQTDADGNVQSGDGESYDTKYDPTNLQPADTDMIKEAAVTNGLINGFIENNVGINFNHDSYFLGDYGPSSDSTKSVYEGLAYKYFSDEFESARQDNSIIASMDFNNFVKLHNKAEEFGKDLRTGTFKEGTPQHMYNYLYQQDWGLFRISALNGYKKSIEEQLDAE